MLHHGRSNKYTFVHKGKKITLVPLTPAQIVHAIIEQLLVEPSLDLSLSHDNLLEVPYDKDELVDDALVLHVLEPVTCVKNKHVIHIATKTDEFKLLSSLHTLVTLNLMFCVT